MEDEETNWLKKLSPVYQYEKWKEEQVKAQQAASQHARDDFHAQEHEYAVSQAARPPQNTGGSHVMPVPVKVEEPPKWWENVLGWVDTHQPAMSILMGIGVGVIAVAGTIVVVGTAAITLPIVAVVAGAALLTSAVLAGIGTIALNSYFDRPLTTKLSQNALIAASIALIISGGGLAVVMGCSTPVGMPFCAAVLPVIDAIEQVSLQVQYAYQVTTGDPQAGETFIELQFEQNDGGAPGNTAFVEFADLFAAHGDEAVGLVNKYGDDAIDALQGRIVDVDNVEEFVADIRILFPDARVWYSTSNGQVYFSSSTEQALTASQKLASTNASGGNITELISEIAKGSTRGSGKRVVLGAYDSNGVYIGDAVENGGIFFDTGDAVWKIIEKEIDPWLVNEQFLRQQMSSGVESIEFVGVDVDVFLDLTVDWGDEIPYRVLEARFVSENASKFGYIRVGNAWVRP